MRGGKTTCTGVRHLDARRMRPGGDGAGTAALRRQHGISTRQGGDGGGGNGQGQSDRVGSPY